MVKQRDQLKRFSFLACATVLYLLLVAPLYAFEQVAVDDKLIVTVPAQYLITPERAPVEMLIDDIKTQSGAGVAFPLTWEFVGRVPQGIEAKLQPKRIRFTGHAAVGSHLGSFAGDGTYHFTMSATDADGRKGSAEWAIIVTQSSSLMLSVPLAQVALPTAFASTPYDVNILKTVSGGVSPYSLSVDGLPSGIGVDEDSGRIVGNTIQTELGSHPLTITVADGGVPSESLSFTVTLSVDVSTNADRFAISPRVSIPENVRQGDRPVVPLYAQGGKRELPNGGTSFGSFTEWSAGYKWNFGRKEGPIDEPQIIAAGAGSSDSPINRFIRTNNQTNYIEPQAGTEALGIITAQDFSDPPQIAELDYHYTIHSYPVLEAEILAPYPYYFAPAGIDVEWNFVGDEGVKGVGVEPYQWEVIGLPPGIEVEVRGRFLYLRGRSYEPGSYNVKVVMTDQGSTLPDLEDESVEFEFIATIGKPITISVEKGRFIDDDARRAPDAVAGERYFWDAIFVNHGEAPYVVSTEFWPAPDDASQTIVPTSGLPEGLSLVEIDGAHPNGGSRYAVHGVPLQGALSKNGVMNVRVLATDKNAVHTDIVASYEFELGVIPQDLLVLTHSLPPLTIGEDYSVPLKVVNGFPSYSWTAKGLPSGLSLEFDPDVDEWSIAGVVEDASMRGTYMIELFVVDNFIDPHRTRVVLSLIVEAPFDAALSIRNSFLPPAMVGVPYSPVLLNASGYLGELDWSESRGFPEGLVVSTDLSGDWKISGTPEAAGTKMVELIVHELSETRVSVAAVILPLVVRENPDDMDSLADQSSSFNLSSELVQGASAGCILHEGRSVSWWWFVGILILCIIGKCTRQEVS